MLTPTKTPAEIRQLRRVVLDEVAKMGRHLATRGASRTSEFALQQDRVAAAKRALRLALGYPH